MSGKNQNDIDGKFGLDVTDFKSGITQINRDIREVRSEFNSASAGMDNWKGSADGLSLKMKSLDSILVSQKKKLLLLRNEYERVAKEEGETSKAAQNLKIRMNNQQGAVNKTEKELRQYKSTLEKMVQEEKEASTATKKLNVDFEKLSDTMDSVGNGLMMGVTLPVGAAVVAIGKSALDLEATEAKYNQVFGTFREDMQLYIDDWQELVAISEVGARGVASGIQDLLVPKGFDRGEAQAMTESAMTWIGAVANMNSATMSAEDVTNSYISGLNRQYDALTSVGVVTNATEVDQKALTLGLADANGEISEQARAIALMKIMYEQSADAIAIFNEENLDTKTKLEISINGLKDAGAELGTELIPIVIKGIDSLNKLVDKFQDMTPAGKKAILTFAGVAAATGPAIKGSAGIIKGFTSVNKLFKKFKADNVVSELGGVTKAAGLVSSGFGAIALPVTLGLGAVAAGVALWNNYLDDVKDSIEDTAVNAEDFFSLMNGDDEESKIDFTTVKDEIDGINEGIREIPSNVSIQVDSSSLAAAKQVIEDLRTEHANLLLTMGDGGSGVDEYNAKVKELGDGLVETKETAMTDFLTGLDMTDLSLSEKTELISEAKTELSDYKDEVNGAVDEIVAFNDAVFNGSDITEEQVEAYDKAIEKLKEYGIVEEELLKTNQSLADTDEVLHQAMASGLTDLGLFGEGVSDYASTFNDELVPVVDAINSAMDVYNTNLSDNSAEVLANKAALEEQKEQQLAVAEAYESLLDPQVINVDGGTGTEFRDYIVGITEGFTTLGETRSDAAVAWAENLEEQEQLAIAQLALGDYFSQYVDFMETEMANQDLTRSESLEAFRSYLSEEDQLMLEQSDALKDSYAKILGYQDTYTESAEETQGKIDALDMDALMTQAEADAQSAAIDTIVTALDGFEDTAGISVPDAVSTLLTAFSESGVAMDEETEALLLKLATLSSEVEDVSNGVSTKGVEAILEPFESMEDDGENVIGNLINGMINGFKENKEGLLAANEGINQGLEGETDSFWETNSPSRKMKRKGGYLMDGLALGMEMNAHKAYAKATEIAAGITGIIEDAWDIHSPSRVGMGLGGNFVSGIGVGMENMTKKLYQNMSKLTDGITNQMQSVTNTYSTSNQNYYNRNVNVKWEAPMQSSDAVVMAAFENKMNKLGRAYGG